MCKVAYINLGNLNELINLFVILDFSNLVLGCSKDRATLWNWEQGFVLVSVEINDTLTHNATLCVKGDRVSLTRPLFKLMFTIIFAGISFYATGFRNR